MRVWLFLLISLLFVSKTSKAEVFIVAQQTQAGSSDYCDLGGSSQYYCDDKALGNKFAVGFRFNTYLTLEAGQLDSGYARSSARYADDSFSGDLNERANVKGQQAMVGTSLPLSESFSFFAKAGVLNYKSTMKGSFSGNIYYGNDQADHYVSTYSDESKGHHATYELGFHFLPNERLSLVVAMQKLKDIEFNMGDYYGTVKTDLSLNSVGIEYHF